MERKQSGFRDELTLVNRDGSLGVSHWDDRKSADAHQTPAYPQALPELNHLSDGTPKVESDELGATIFQITPAPRS